MPLSPTYSEIRKISFPLIFGGFAQTLINITDAIFLGRWSETALGASAIAGLLFITLFMLGMGLGIGSQIIIARLDGEGHFKEIGAIFHTTIYFLLILSVSLLLFSLTFGSELLTHFVVSEKVLAESIEYLQTRSWGFIFSFIMVAFRSLFVGIGQTKIIFSSTVFMASLNVFLNYCFIFGNLGFPEMGIKGAALASVIAEFFTAILYVFYTYKVFDINKYGLFLWYKPKLNHYLSILKISIPMMFQLFFSLSSWFIFFLIVEKIGERELAISNIARNIYMILMVPILGFSSATSTLVSNLIGQGKQQEVIPLVYRIALMSFIFSFSLSVINFAMARVGISFFTDLPQLQDETVPVMHIVSGALLFFSVASIFLSGVSGTGNTAMGLGIEVITIAFYLIATYYLAIHIKASLPVVWCVEFIYFTFIGILSYFYLRFGKWQKIKISE